MTGKLQVTCKCSAPMRRINGKYGIFYGCTTYPRCREKLSDSQAKQQIEDKKNGPKVEKEFKPSAYQQAIFDFISDGKGNGLVEAVAGSGKTTTIVKALSITPKNESVVFCAFNKHIADELKRKAPRHVTVATLHSLGFTALRAALPYKPQVDNRKLWYIVKEVLPAKEDYHLRAPLSKLVSLAKATLVDRNDPIAIGEMAAYYGVELNGDADRLIKLVPTVLMICQERLATIDFDDMIWLPIVLNFHIESYDWVFIDECQDLNKVQVELALRLVKDTGRVVAVGDRFQSIYGFRGADVNAIPNLINALNAKTLPLSITYRCPRSHVNLAKALVPAIEAADNAIDGEVRNVRYSEALSQFGEGDLILCRVNAPLITACYSLIRRGTKATIRGRDIAKSLQNLIDRLKPYDIYDLLSKLTQYYAEQARKFEASGKEDRIQGLQDRCDTLRALCDGVRDLTELRSNIERIFNDITKTGVILSSVHRAKGDESDRVWILRPDLMPHPLAKKDWQMAQELNIKYVALTRSKKSLTFVTKG